MPLASNTPDQGWFSRERVLLLTLGLATLLALYLCYLIVQPFIPAVAIAVAAAVASKRPQKWLARRLRRRRAPGGGSYRDSIEPADHLPGPPDHRQHPRVAGRRRSVGVAQHRQSPAGDRPCGRLGADEPGPARPNRVPGPESGRPGRQPARRLRQPGYATRHHALRALLPVPSRRTGAAHPAPSRTAFR